MTNRTQAALDMILDDEESDGIIVPSSIETSFQLPNRNWNRLVDNYNSSNKRFPLTALQCKSIIEHVKRGIPSVSIFKSMGYSKSKYGTLLQVAMDLEEEYEILFNKEELSDEEATKIQELRVHPLRILMGDIVQADGIADLMLWEKFNERASGPNLNPELLLTIMKARFREMFNEKAPETSSVNVQINVGGEWVRKLTE